MYEMNRRQKSQIGTVRTVQQPRSFSRCLSLCRTDYYGGENAERKKSDAFRDATSNATEGEEERASITPTAKVSARHPSGVLAVITQYSILSGNSISILKRRHRYLVVKWCLVLHEIINS